MQGGGWELELWFEHSLGVESGRLHRLPGVPTAVPTPLVDAGCRLGIYAWQFVAFIAFLTIVPQRRMLVTAYGKETIVAYLLSPLFQYLFAFSGLYADVAGCSMWCKLLRLVFTLIVGASVGTALLSKARAPNPYARRRARARAHTHHWHCRLADPQRMGVPLSASTRALRCESAFVPYA